LNSSIARSAVNIYATLKSKGKLIDHIAIFIAASAMFQGYFLHNNNYKHFKRIPGLVFYNQPAGNHFSY